MQLLLRKDCEVWVLSGWAKVQTQFCKSIERGFSGQPKMAFHHPFHHLILSYRSSGRLGGHCEDVSPSFSSIPSLSLGGQNYLQSNQIQWSFSVFIKLTPQLNQITLLLPMPLSSLAPSGSHLPALPPHWLSLHTVLCQLLLLCSTLTTECPQINPQASHSFLFPCSVLFKSHDQYHHKQADIHVLKFIYLTAYKLSVFCFFPPCPHTWSIKSSRFSHQNKF